MMQGDHASAAADEQEVRRLAAGGDRDLAAVGAEGDRALPRAVNCHVLVTLGCGCSRGSPARGRPRSRTAPSRSRRPCRPAAAATILRSWSLGSASRSDASAWSVWWMSSAWSACATLTDGSDPRLASAFAASSRDWAVSLLSIADCRWMSATIRSPTQSRVRPTRAPHQPQPAVTDAGSRGRACPAPRSGPAPCRACREPCLRVPQLGAGEQEALVVSVLLPLGCLLAPAGVLPDPLEVGLDRVDQGLNAISKSSSKSPI